MLAQTFPFAPVGTQNAGCLWWTKMRKGPHFLNAGVLSCIAWEEPEYAPETQTRSLLMSPSSPRLSRLEAQL